MRIDIATLFVDMCEQVMNESIIGRARRENKFQLYCHNIRDYTQNKQRQVDDYPYGGGHGMILQADPIARCLDAILWQYEVQGLDRPRICFMTAAGAPYNQAKTRHLAGLQGLVLVCGHYEGIDQRVIEAYKAEELSIGDYVLTGGELAALSVADSVLRLQPGVLKSWEGYVDESFYSGTLEYPHYSRPAVWRERAVPEVLLSGHAANINAWRQRQALARTKTRRPDLYAKLPPCLREPQNAAKGKKRKTKT